MVLSSEFSSVQVQTDLNQPDESTKEKDYSYLGGETEAVQALQASMYGMAEIWQIIWLASSPDQR